MVVPLLIMKTSNLSETTKLSTQILYHITWCYWCWHHGSTEEHLVSLSIKPSMFVLLILGVLAADMYVLYCFWHLMFLVLIIGIHAADSCYLISFCFWYLKFLLLTCGILAPNTWCSCCWYILFFLQMHGVLGVLAADMCCIASDTWCSCCWFLVFLLLIVAIWYVFAYVMVVHLFHYW